MQNSKVARGLGIVFLIVGILIVIGAVVFRIRSIKFYATAVETTATIERIEEYEAYDNVDEEYKIKHNVYIEYDTQDGEHYDNVELGWYQDAMQEGQQMVVYYEPDNPEDVRSKEGSLAVCIVMVILGAVFAVIGGLFVVQCENVQIGEDDTVMHRW